LQGKWRVGCVGSPKQLVGLEMCCTACKASCAPLVWDKSPAHEDLCCPRPILNVVHDDFHLSQSIVKRVGNCEFKGPDCSSDPLTLSNLKPGTCARIPKVDLVHDRECQRFSVQCSGFEKWGRQLKGLQPEGCVCSWFRVLRVPCLRFHGKGHGAEL